MPRAGEGCILVIGVTGGLGLIGDRKLSVLLVALALALTLAFVPGTASAADPANAQYNSSLQQLPTAGGGTSCIESGSAGSASSGGSSEECVSDEGGGGLVGSLPFTGLDVAVLALVAAVLLAAGLILRRRRDPGVEG